MTQGTAPLTPAGKPAGGPASDCAGEPAVIEVVINGEARRVPAGRSVVELLDHLGLHPGLVVVELNREILRRETLDGTMVGEGDRIELVHFVGGG